MIDPTAIVRRLVSPLAQRIRLTVARGVVNLVNDSLKCQGLQVSLLADEVRDDVEHFQEFGFTSRPLVGAEVLFLSVGGNRAHGIVACVTDRRYRPKNMGEGDVCLFTANGERVYLDATADTLNLGAKSGADFLAKATNTESRLVALETIVKAHVHPTGVGPSSPITPTAILNTPAQPVTTTKVKAT